MSAGILLDAHNGETYIFASANPAVFKIAAKFSNTLVLHMPLFALYELQQCRAGLARFCNVTEDDVNAAFALVGGVARSALLELANWGSLPALRESVYGKVKELATSNLDVRHRPCVASADVACAAISNIRCCMFSNMGPAFWPCRTLCPGWRRRMPFPQAVT